MKSEEEQQNQSMHTLAEEQRQRIAVLERAFAEAEHRAQKHLQERDHWHEQHWKAHQENRQLQQQYESLRVQKGGFGFTMLLLTGFAGTVLGLVACYVFMRLHNDQVRAFQRFRGEQQFQLEFDLSHGNFNGASSVLQRSAQHPDYQPILPEIEFVHKVVVAAKQGCGK